VRFKDLVDWPLALPTIGLLLGLGRGWLQPALHPSASAFRLDVVLPATDLRPISWGLILATAVVLVAVAQTSWGHPRALFGELAAVLSVTATLGFLIQSCFVDHGLQRRMSRDTADLAALQRIAGFTIPRPHLTTFGPIPLPNGAAEIFSGLRSGFYVALVSSIALAFVMLKRHRRADSAAAAPNRNRPRPVVLALAVVLLALTANLLQVGVAEYNLSQARTAAVTGDDASSIRHFKAALAQGVGLSQQPDIAAEYGLALIRGGATTSAPLQLAASRLLLLAGRDLPALQTVGEAARRWPTDSSLQDEFVTQALRYLQRRGAPQAVHLAMSASVDRPVLRVALSRYEIVSGDNPSAITDARAAASLARDTEVRSVALTFLSIAQTRSGETAEGRRTLLDAVDADKDYVNVMARSLLTGLYSTLPI
jgi:hypothetical protein